LELKLDDGELRGLHLRKPGKTLSQTEPMSTKIDELFATLRGLIADQARVFAMAMAELANVAKQRDKLKAEIAVANEKMDSLACVLDGCRIQRTAAAIERDDARQSLRAAEADAAETESANSDLRAVNRRLVADLAAAMERLNHAESIIMQ